MCGMETLGLLVIRLSVMAVTAGAAELLVPDGSLRGCVWAAVGLSFVAAAVTEIIRIFGMLGG